MTKIFELPPPICSFFTAQTPPVDGRSFPQDQWQEVPTQASPLQAAQCHLKNWKESPHFFTKSQQFRSKTVIATGCLAIIRMKMFKYILPFFFLYNFMILYGDSARFTSNLPLWFSNAPAARSAACAQSSKRTSYAWRFSTSPHCQVCFVFSWKNGDFFWGGGEGETSWGFKKNMEIELLNPFRQP